MNHSQSEESFPQQNDRRNIQHVQCCIVGCGPAGAMLGYLLARHGVGVLVLEKHSDFLRDFRGDTIHPSTIQIMNELGLADRLLQLPHTKAPTLQVRTSRGPVTLADFRHLKTRWPYLVFLPQWDFLNFLTGEAQHYPGFHLLMNAEGQGLIEEDGEIRGVYYSTPEGRHEVRASLVVAADGRTSEIRKQAGLVPIEKAPPMDVLWFKLSRRQSDPDDTFASVGEGHILGLINRRDYWQVAYVIPKGTYQRIHAAGLEQFKQSLRELVPQLADRVDELQTWDQVKLLVVQANRLRLWYRPGLLCIGDAAHAMSPVGGVGINLAIQDAVIAANVLAKPLKAGRVRIHHLAQVQGRRELPTRIIQALQSVAQQRVTAPALSLSEPPKLPAPIRMLLRLPLIPTLPARLIAFGVWPVHIRNTP
jgi:2-polyprenyl-6-methoxyphenol hydroxylase-like FAD-dependent oxidoreductase